MSQATGAESASRLNLAEGMDAAAVALLEALGVRQVVAKGDSVVLTGDEDDAIYGVLDGAIMVKADDGRLVSILGAGDTFGEIGFLTRSRRTADVVAHSDAQLLRLPGDALRGLIDSEPAIAARFYANLAREMAPRLATTTKMALL